MTSPRFPVLCHREIPSISSSWPPSIWTLDCHSITPIPQASRAFPGRLAELRAGFGMKLSWGRWSSYRGKLRKNFFVKVSASGDPVTSETDSVPNEAVGAGKGDPFNHFRGVISSLPPVVFVMKRNPGANFVIGFCIATAIFFIVGRVYAARNAISTPLKYEDPFNNPLVKVGKKNSTVEMCGKVYRLAPVTLTKEEETIHKRRRSRAYQWKRPTMFLKEGDTIPPDVDPDTVRWIPANHPFATTASDIDEDLAQTNVYQKHGVPFRIQAEHEALQRKLEALQREERLDKLVIDRGNAKDFERQFKFQAKSQDVEQGPPFKPSKSDFSPSPAESNSSSEEIQKS
ncbi:hypothetical protein CRG98_007922 [Punica granatum]|uniref:Protein MULTIPLE CHLOROPLAST DIVISION SITE 1 n=1 Tax=Punica granatum TaxID=22663 RepID=A0A2I0KTP1_PUNGR|nr:hypothetical protein CRG98_007922 [Punica granatum]